MGLKHALLHVHLRNASSQTLQLPLLTARLGNNRLAIHYLTLDDDFLGSSFLRRWLCCGGFLLCGGRYCGQLAVTQHMLDCLMQLTQTSCIHGFRHDLI